MIPFFPKAISNKGLLFYFISLAVVSLVFMNYTMGLPFMLIGMAGVLLFFYGSQQLTVQWQQLPAKQFAQQLFWVALGIRVVWVVFSYYFYIRQTGQPFEFESADALGYHEEAKWLAGQPWKKTWDYLFVKRTAYSDSGYSLYLTVLYRLFGPQVLLARFLKVLMSSFTCVLLYKLAARNTGEKVGRMAGIFAMLMPNLIVYCGLHLKETEMLFLMVAFLERADYLMRSNKNDLLSIGVPILLAFSLFLFRTVLGAVALFSLLTALVFSPKKIVARGRRWVIAFWMILAVAVLGGGAIMNEVEDLWSHRETNQELKRMEQTVRGNQWAKYATGTVMVPMVFVLPFSTMVDMHQENQLVLHGGNYVRNFMGVFVLLAFISALFIQKNWRDFALIGSFVVAYLGAVSLSGFSNSERFLLPGLPCLIIFWAYGLSLLNARNYRFVKYWFLFVPVMEIGWAVFKIGSRGLF